MTNLNEVKSKEMLTEFGIPIPKGYVVTERASNCRIGIALIKASSYVIKVISNDIIHKSDVGGVKLNIKPSHVQSTIIEMDENFREKILDAKIDGYFLQEMVSPGIECIIGVKEDPQFGKVIMFGMGGIFTEVFKDVSMRVLPTTEKDVQEMIDETKISKILRGARGKVYDINNIIDTIMKVSLLTDKYNIKELDINPLIVHEQNIIALDARIMI